MQSKIYKSHILEDTLPVESIEHTIHIPVSFPSRLDFKYVYPRVLCPTGNNAIRIFRVFVLLFCERTRVSVRIDASIPPMLYKSLNASERARAYNNESLRNQLQINSESATGSNFLLVDPFFIGYGRNSVGRNSASQSEAKKQIKRRLIWYISRATISFL